MANILVTGGAGFIGSHTVVELVAAGHRPIVVDDHSNSRPDVVAALEALTGQAITAVVHDVGDRAAVRALLEREGVDGVIHFAAHKAVGESVLEPLRYYRNNVAGSIELLGAVTDVGVPAFVFSSSCTVYGEPDRLPIDEGAPIKPATSPYGATKQMIETVLRDVTTASTTLRSTSLRYFNPIGAHPSARIGELPLGVPANLVPFVAQVAAGIRPQLTIHGDDYDTPDGTCVRDYIHVVDLARAHVAALAHLGGQPAGASDVFNIGTGTGRSVLEVVTTFEAVTGVPVPREVGPRRAGDIVSIYAAADRARDVLGWTAELPLGQALEDAWRWQRTLG